MKYLGVLSVQISLILFVILVDFGIKVKIFILFASLLLSIIKYVLVASLVTPLQNVRITHACVMVR